MAVTTDLFFVQNISYHLPFSPRKKFCRAGAGVAVSAVAIDDRRCFKPPSRDHRDIDPEDINIEQETNFVNATPDPTEKELRVSSEGAAVFCGDTKGNILGFLERPMACSSEDNSRSERHCQGSEEEKPGGHGGVATKGVEACLLLKRQHSKNQVESSTQI